MWFKWLFRQHSLPPKTFFNNHSYILHQFESWTCIRTGDQKTKSKCTKITLNSYIRPHIYVLCRWDRFVYLSILPKTCLGMFRCFAWWCVAAKIIYCLACAFCISRLFLWRTPVWLINRTADQIGKMAVDRRCPRIIQLFPWRTPVQVINWTITNRKRMAADRHCFVSFSICEIYSCKFNLPGTRRWP